VLAVLFVLFTKYYCDEIKDKADRTYDTNGEMRNAYQISVRNP
jgi:hypothetical protein